MSIFATEFPVRSDITNATFVAAAIAWIRGINKSTVLENLKESQLHEDDVLIQADSGELLQFKSYKSSDLSAVGVRHELPDSFGRIWRTECVLTNLEESSILRVRGQCVAASASAIVQLPKKPHFITSTISEGWGSSDALFQVGNSPHFLTDDDIDTALAIVTCANSSLLPHVYVSRGDDNSISVDLEVLSRKLAGMAHIVVEPTRSFSFQLMGKSFRKNPYAGAVGVFVPNFGEVSRHFVLGPSHQKLERSTEIVETVITLVSKRAATKGFEWQGLQEAQGKHLRAQLSLNSSDEIEKYVSQFDSEILAKDEQIKNLTQLLELSKNSKDVVTPSTHGLLPEWMTEKIGPQLYEGEFSDRLRHVIELSSSIGELDPRTQTLVKLFLDHYSYSGRSIALVNQIKSAGKDGSEMLHNLGSILTSFGYDRTTDGKHVKFEPPKGLFGLPPEVLPSTPSDSQRGGKNKASEIIRNFGLNSFK